MQRGSRVRAVALGDPESTVRALAKLSARSIRHYSRIVSEEQIPEIDLLADPTYLDAVTDLLGVLAYAELVAFERLAYDARMAPTLEDKAALARLATAEFGHYQLLERHLDGMGVGAEKAMAPFVVPLEAFHAQTAPSDWAESLVKAYVGDGIAADFYREIAKLLDPTARALVLEVLADTGHAEFAVERVRQAIAADPTIAGRLALWGRRIVGEALAQAQAVCAEREALVTLLVGGVAGANADISELMRTFTRITDAHMRRMAALGLSA
jgi:tRNA-(MS[2]IO[6]A)-hydroxylase (MiaE)-like